MRRPLVLTALATALASASHAQPAAVAPCPFTPAELTAALGVPFKAGQPGQPIKTSSITMQSCRYEGTRYSLRVGTTLYNPPADAAKHTMILAGTKVPIAGDPDGAIYQEGQGDNTDPVVVYSRKGVAVELRAVGLWYDEPSGKMAALRTIREKLAKLKRVP